MITVSLHRLDLKPGSRILDIGCGTGRHAGAAIRYRDIFVVATDIGLAPLQTARSNLGVQKKLGEAQSPWSLCAADITRLPFGDESFDAVICSEVLEHIPDHSRAVCELKRVVKPGKMLAVSVPSRVPEHICWRLSKPYRTAQGGHLRIYTRKGLTDLMARAGFVLCRRHTAHSLHTPYWWLKCLVGPSRADWPIVRLYHRFLVWEMFRKPRAARLLESLLNPVLGKSIVLYFRKGKK